MTTQFLAKLKKSSKYHGQADGWFPISFNYRYDDFCICGNENVYRFADVIIGVRREDGEIVVVKK